jgi:hypothetical protein
MRRTPLLVVALLALCLGLVTFAPARGQQPVPTEETRVFHLAVTPANGYATISTFGGFSTGLLDASCTGNTPLGGPVVPLAVMATLRSTDIQVRVVSWAAGGTFAVVNGTRVLINCAIDAPTGFWEGPAVAAKAAQLREQARQ